MFRTIAAAVGALCILTGVSFAQAAPEKSEITIGLPVTTSTFLPLYLAEKEGYFKEEGLDVKIVAFRGGTDLVRGMIAGSVDIGVTSLAGVNVGIAADQPIKAFYGGFNMAVFEWYAVKGITSLEQTKGKRFGVTRIGSSTDFLTRYALKSKGIDPDKDVQIIQGGGSQPRIAAMEAGQLDVNIVATPEKFIVADRGYNKVLSQTDIAPDFPFHVFFATDDFRKNNPNTIRAMLRGFVKGVRKSKADKDLAVQVLMDSVGLEKDYAERGYDDFIDGIYEDGRLPSEAGMTSFWNIGIESGEYTEAWPEEKFLDRTFMDSYAEWKPGA